MISAFETPEFLTVNEAAEVLHTSRQAVYRRIASGELYVVRIGTGPKAPIRIAPADLVDYLRRANEAT